MKYFQQFSQLMYTFDNPANNNFYQVNNIFARVKMLDSVINNIAVYYTYSVQDSDRPDTIAAKYYSDPDRHWIILFTNKLIDPYFQWPLNQDEFEQMLINNYGSVANSQIVTDHIEKQTVVISTKNQSSNVQIYVSVVPNNVIKLDGSSLFPTVNTPIIQVGSNNVVSFPDGSMVDESVNLVWVSAYQQAYNQNESNRNIKLIDPAYVPQIEAELQALL